MPDDWRAKHREQAMRERRLLWAPVQYVSRARYRNYWRDRPGLERSVKPFTKRTARARAVEAIAAAERWGSAVMVNTPAGVAWVKKLTDFARLYGEYHFDAGSGYATGIWAKAWIEFELADGAYRIDLVQP